MKTFLVLPRFCLLVALTVGIPSALPAAGLRPIQLRCEQQVDPLGIDQPEPHLSWTLQAGQGAQDLRGRRQTAFQIRVASSPAALRRAEADLWDSGKVASEASVLVAYGGKRLESRQRCYWQVRVWDETATVGPWSQIGFWTMGFLGPEDWGAQWITAPEAPHPLQGCSWVWSDRAVSGEPSMRPPETRWFRLRFAVAGLEDLASATLALTADNSFVAFLNGVKVLEGTSWETLHQAQVGELLHPGANVLAVVATNGGQQPNPAGLLGALTLTPRQGEPRVVLVDSLTRTSDREETGWNRLDFDDGAWKPAVEVAAFGGGQWGSRPVAPPPLPVLRTAFQISQPVRRAELAICGLGFYEARLNGAVVDDVLLEPGWTHYGRSVLYRVVDVTALVRRGENVLGVLLGNGMYHVTGGRYTKFTGSFGPPKLIARLDVEYRDGSSERFVSDGGWKAAAGPVRFSCIYGGEDYDARHELPGWDQPGFDEGSWGRALECEGPGGKLSTRGAPPIKVRETHETATIHEPLPGVWVYDLGQNFSGWPQIEVEGPRGATVKLIPGELLDEQGLVSQRSSGGPVWFSYTLKGQGAETWRPRFSYSGFRYLQVEGAAPAGAVAVSANLPRLRRVQGEFLYPDASVHGAFACSNPDVNRVHALILAAIKSNFKSVLTDCPHREKLGWLECSHLLAGCLMFNFESARFYAKIAKDMRESQLPDGLVPSIAPEYVVFQGGFRDSPEWGSAAVISPWRAYWMYGDRRLLEEQYETMVRYVGYLGGKSKNHILSHGLGDWYDIGPRGPGESQLTSLGLTATGVYYQDLDILRQVAEWLGKDEDARRFGALAVKVKEALNAAFFRPDEAHYDRNSQTANAMPLFLGIVPPAHRPAVLDSLVRDVRSRGNRVTAGDVGFYYVVQALLDGGRSDVLYDMLCQTNGPGYLYQLSQNATSLTEAWDTNPGSSQNHCMLGHIEEWFYTGLLGIRPAEPGFRRIQIHPQVVGDLVWAKGHYESPYGRIGSSWTRTAGELCLEVSVPVNTTATVFVPYRGQPRVTESGQPVAQTPGVRFLRVEGQTVVFEVGSGAYRFTAPY